MTQGRVVLELQRWFAGVAYDHVQKRMSSETSVSGVNGCVRVLQQHDEMI